MSTTSSFGKFILGSLVGGAVGAVVGMLLAPRSGVETREMIRDEVSSRYRESRRNLDEKATLIKDKAVAVKEKARHLGEELEDAGRRTVERFKANGKTASAPTEESPVTN